MKYSVQQNQGEVAKKHIPIINNIYINNKDHNKDNYRSGNDDKAFFQGNIINPKGV